VAKTLTSEQWFARFQALEEAADHLQLDWTDVALEQEQGLIASRHIRRLADQAKSNAYAALRREQAGSHDEHEGKETD
jgi:hypothetical protein